MAAEKTKKEKTSKTAKAGADSGQDSGNGNGESGDRADRRIDTWKARVQLVVVVVFIIAALALSQLMRQDDSPEKTARTQKPLLVQTVTVSPFDQLVTFEKTGTVRVRTYVNIVPQISGRIVTVSPSFRDGAVFEKDEILFVIEQADFQNQLDMAQAEVERAQTVLALAQAETEAAREEWKSLHPEKEIPDLVARIPQLQQAQAELKAAKARLADAQLDFGRTEFSLPYDGRVVSSDLEVGQYVSTGQSYGQVYPERSLEVVVPVQDRILQWVSAHPDSRTQITTRYQGRELILKGVVSRIGGQLDENTRFANLIVEPRGDGWEKLLPGVFVEVRLFGPELKNIWALPNAALQGQDAVWIVQEDNTLKYYRPDIISVDETTTLAKGTGEPVRLVKGLLKGATAGMAVRTVGEGDVPEASLEQDVSPADLPETEIESGNSEDVNNGDSE